MDSSSKFPKYIFLLNPSVGIIKAVVKNQQMGVNAHARTLTHTESIALMCLLMNCHS